MRKYFVGQALALAATMIFSSTLCAQTAPKAAAKTEKPAAMEKVARTSDGVPDFSGVWEGHMPPSARKYAGYSFTGDIPAMTAWGKAQYEMTKPSWGPRAVEDSTDMVNPTTGNEIGCFPTGVPRIYVHPFPMEILQVPGRVVQLFEFNHFVRQLYITKGSHEHAKDLDPTWMGDAVAWWEGDTLVVDSVGFNDKTWLDRAGLPHSDQLHVIEHISAPQPQDARRAHHHRRSQDIRKDLGRRAHLRAGTGLEAHGNDLRRQHHLQRFEEGRKRAVGFCSTGFSLCYLISARSWRANPQNTWQSDRCFCRASIRVRSP